MPNNALQTSDVLSQKAWPGAGDLDDCWVLSALQMVHVVLPWLNLPSVPAFRKAAGDPDDGEADGGTQGEIIKGLTTLWPFLRPHLPRFDGRSWVSLVLAVDQHRPVSLAVVSKHLPPRLRFGFDGYHRITLVKTYDKRLLVANPLAAPYSNWIELALLEEIRDAVLRYGEAKTGKRGAWFIVGPTADQALQLHPMYAGLVTDAVHIAAADLTAANKELTTKLDEATAISTAAVDAARAAIAAETAFVAKFGG